MTGTVEHPSEVAAPAPSRRLRITLIALIAIFGLLGAAASGWLIRGDDSAASPGTSSVDAGFARDMSTHHRQAITMAGYERDNTTNPALKVLAYDIETSQQFQVGEMEAWLATWGLPFQTDRPPMAWMDGMSMSHQMNGGMPGMATPAELNRLETLHGKATDILFLQLMIRHHQGGLAMAQYGLDHAGQRYVRDLAQAIVNGQRAEIIQMTQMLRELGGHPLPAAN